MTKFKSKVKKGKGLQFYEEGSIVHKGKKFTSTGAFLGKHKKTGLLGGILYAFPKEGKVGDWAGKKKYNAKFGKEWASSFGDIRQSVKVRIGDKEFTGTYFKSGSDIVRIREKKKLKKVM